MNSNNHSSEQRRTTKPAFNSKEAYSYIHVDIEWGMSITSSRED